MVMPILDQPFMTTEDKKAIQRLNVETKKMIRAYRTIPFDWNIVAEIINAEFDELLGKPTKQTIFQSNPALRKIYAEMDVPEYSLDEQLAVVKDGSLKNVADFLDKESPVKETIGRWKKMSLEERSVYFGKTFSDSFTQTSELLAYQFREGTLAFAMAKTAIALRLYKVESGTYPAALDNLVEKGYLPVVPTDSYRKDADVPLIYRVEADGSCILYSVGANGIDDGGKFDSSWRTEDKDTRRDDVVVQLN
jgi:hypothetical protein